MTTTIRDTPTTGGEAREATSWSLYVVHHPSARHVGLRRVLLRNVSIDLCRDGDALGPGGLADPRMSRRHCRLTVSSRDDLTLRDLGSRNGTWVNGVACDERALDDDDVLRVGGVLLAVQRGPTTLPAFGADDPVAAGWPMARVLEGLRALPPTQRLVALHGEPATGIDAVARWLAAREGLAFSQVSAVPPRADEGCVTLVGPLAGVDAATASALRVATPEVGRLVLWVETLGRDTDAELDATLAALTPAAWRVPPLRERMVDLPELLARIGAATHGRAARVHHRLMLSLLRSPWPGNLKQLEAFVRGHLAPTADGEPVRWSESVVEPLGAQGYLERSAAGEDDARPAPSQGTYRIARDGRWFDLPDGVRVQVQPRRALCRMLGALVEHHARGARDALSTPTLVEVGWPGERLVGLSGPGRVYVALSTLRKLGLRDVLQRCDDGYRLGGAQIVAAEP